MKKYFKFCEIPSEEAQNPEFLNSFEKYRFRYHSPFKPRGPTPPRSKESSPKLSSQPKTFHFRHSSVDSGDVFVLKVPFSSVNSVNLTGVSAQKRKSRGRKEACSRRHRRTGSLEIF